MPIGYSQRSLAQLITLAIVVFSLACPANADRTPFDDAFAIREFRSIVTINRDASVSVDELIDLQVLAPIDIINRDLSLKRPSASGEPVGVYLVVDSLYIDGNAVTKFEDFRLSDAWRIEIPVSQGVKRCRILYTLYNALDVHPGLEEFDWDLVGMAWQAQIEHAEAQIQFESGTFIEGLEFDCHTGSLGYKTGDCFAEQYGSRVVVSATRGLRKFEGLKISMSWPPGLIVPPSKWQQIIWEYDLLSNWIWGVPAITLLIMFARWLRKRLLLNVNDLTAFGHQLVPIDGDNLSILDIGLLYWERDSDWDMTATLLDLAIRGHIELREILDSLLRDYQIVEKGGIRGRASELERSLVGLSQRVYEGATSKASVLGKILLDEKTKLRRSVENSLVQRRYFHIAPSTFRKQITVATIVTVAATIFAGLYMTNLHPAIVIAVAVLGGMPLGAMAYFDIVKTVKGIRAYRSISNLRNYLIDRSPIHSPSALPTSEFEHYLPHALILDAVPQWAARFRRQQITKPEWLVIANRAKMPNIDVALLQNAANNLHLQLTPVEKVHTDVYADYGPESKDTKESHSGDALQK